MKYKLAFVNEIKNYRHNFYYLEELKELFGQYDMMEYWDTKITPTSRYRWSSDEVFKALESQ